VRCSAAGDLELPEKKMKKILAAAALAALVAGCGVLPKETVGPARKENIFAVTEGMALVSFNAGQPQDVKTVGKVQGLEAGEWLVGIDFRVARGILYGLGSTGRLYTIDTRSAQAKAVGGAPLALEGREFGFDFNPTVDRIRVVSDTGQNFRVHPDTGAMVDGDPGMPGVQPDGPLAFAPGDVEQPIEARIVAAAYTYNKQNDKITTNYAIDMATSSLVTQGTREGVQPSVSPNTGQLYIVGSLGVMPFRQAGFDIADVTGVAYLSLNHGASSPTRFYSVDLRTGRATFIGTVGGERLRGISVEP
jgi:hypothetical protein